jgi:diacylglycerol kinase family enzyme
LAVLPAGTVNVFARELGLPFQLEKAWGVIERGRELAIDVPRIDFLGGATTPRWFAQMAGCGLDARAVQLMEWNLKKRIGRFAYVVSGLKALREKRALVTVTAGNRNYAGELVIMGNGRLYGGPFTLFPRADLCDGVIDVCVFPKINWFVLMRSAFASLPFNVLNAGPGQRIQASEFRIDGPAAVPVQMDGDCVGQLPVTCRIEPRALRVLIP